MCVRTHPARVRDCWSDEAVHLAPRRGAERQLSNSHLQDLLEFWLEKEGFGVGDFRFTRREVLALSWTGQPLLLSLWVMVMGREMGCLVLL